jgi:methyl-accepting chemotaxis protein
MKNLGMTGRLYVAIAAVALGLIACAAYTITQLKNIDRIATRTEIRLVPQLQRMAAVELNITRASLQLRHAMLSRTPEERAATLADVSRLKSKIDGLLREFEQALSTEGGQQRMEAMKPVIAEFWRVGSDNIALIKQGQTADAFAFLNNHTIPARNALLEQIAEAVVYQETTLRNDVAKLRQDATATRNAFVGMVVAISLGLVALAWYLGKALRQRVNEVRLTAERVRDGDFTRAVVDSDRDEFSPLILTMRDMQSSLARLVTDVRSNAEHVASTSVEIAQGNQDLSLRTEQQAGALQETASTMDEFGNSVRLNADNARQANQLAQAASGVAVRGGEVMGQVVETMKGISDSSQRIADIIGTIDGIAFQTNILALNAAVEAARAGEQGRGFAVVAGEVRTLAQRSAEAAKEIKGLIGASVARVEQGAALVDQAGQTMQEVVSAIRRVTDIVGEISAASADQSLGVDQVGQTINDMDQSTQQNATLVKQSTASAMSLKAQADSLVKTVSVFKLKAEVH